MKLSDDEVFEHFRTYVSLKLHFNSDEYSVVQAKGHLKNTSKSSFRKRNDRKVFVATARNLANLQIDPKEFFLANFSRNSSFWFGDYEDGLAIYKVWKGLVSNLDLTLKNDCKFISEKCIEQNTPFLSMIQLVDSARLKAPEFATWILGNEISLESATLLANGLPILRLWSTREYRSKFEKMGFGVYDDLLRRLRKYAEFFDVNKRIKNNAAYVDLFLKYEPFSEHTE